MDDLQPYVDGIWSELGELVKGIRTGSTTTDQLKKIEMAARVGKTFAETGLLIAQQGTERLRQVEKARRIEREDRTALLTRGDRLELESGADGD